MADMEKDKEKLREQLNDVSSALEYHQQHSVEKHKLLLAEQRIRDLEAKLELEISQKLRLEVKQLRYNICNYRWLVFPWLPVQTSIRYVHYLFYFIFIIWCTEIVKEFFYRVILQALMVKANDEVESLKDQIQELNSLREKDLNVNRKTRKDISTLQEQLEDLRKREMDLVHKCKQVVSWY